MRFNSGLEHVKAQRAIAVRSYLFSCSIDRCRHVLHERHNIAEEFHHAAYAHILGCAHTKYRIYRTVNQSFADALSHLIFCQMSLIKEFFHERLIIFGCSFHELLVKIQSLRHFLFRYIFNRRHASVGPPRVFLHQQDIDHSIERCAAGKRILDLY